MKHIAIIGPVILLAIAMLLGVSPVAYADDGESTANVDIDIFADNVNLDVDIDANNADVNINGQNINSLRGGGVGANGAGGGSAADLETYQYSRWAWEWVNTMGVALANDFYTNLAPAVSAHDAVARNHAANLDSTAMRMDRQLEMDVQLESRVEELEVNVNNHLAHAVTQEEFLAMEQNIKADYDFKVGILFAIIVVLIGGLGITLFKLRSPSRKQGS